MFISGLDYRCAPCDLMKTASVSGCDYDLGEFDVIIDPAGLAEKLLKDFFVCLSLYGRKEIVDAPIEWTLFACLDAADGKRWSGVYGSASFPVELTAEEEKYILDKMEERGESL